MPADQVTLTVLAPSDRTTRLRLGRLARRLRRAVARPSRAFTALTSASPEHALWKHGISELSTIVSRVVIYDGSEADLLRRCQKQAIDVLMPVMTPLQDQSMPWVGYLYDCQHRHHPEFFSSVDRFARDEAFEKMLETAPVVFANAKAVVSDLKAFFPHRPSKLFSLPFAPMIDEAELIRAVAGVPKACQRFGTGTNYFIVCNQFWIHKDHATAFRAFAQYLALRGRDDVRLVCTGLASDFRMPEHFAKLRRLIGELGITERVIFTGYLDRSEQQSLLYGATALLQPTLFEGGPGGGAASDAIALGVPCILSNIAVNQELAHSLVSFFDVGDPESLAGVMELVTCSPPPRPSQGELLVASRKRAQELGASLLALACEAKAR